MTPGHTHTNMRTLHLLRTCECARPCVCADRNAQDVRFANFFYAANGADLRELVRLADAGALSVGVEKVYAVDELPAAIERSMSGKASGKLLLKFEE